MDSIKAAETVSAMWLDLGNQIKALVPTLVTDRGPADAIHWATCAEACFWKSTNEGDPHDVKDILRAKD